MDQFDLATVTGHDDARPRSSTASDVSHGEPIGSPGPLLQHVLRLIEEQGQSGFWWHEVPTDKITVSAGLARITGVPVTVTRTPDSMLKAIHPQDRIYHEDMMGLMGLGQPIRREFRIMRPDGTIRWVSSKVEIVLGADGAPTRYIGILVDVTERREAQRAVEFNHERRAALLEATSAVTWIADLSGQAIDPASWCVLTGMDPRECGGEGWLEAVHPEDRERIRAAYRSAIGKGSNFNADYRVRTADGCYAWFNGRSAAVRDASGTIREWQGVLLPIDQDRRSVDVGDPEPGEALILSGAQIRGARGLLDWSLAQLASTSGVSVSTIKRMEDGSEGSTRPSKVDAVRRALQRGGINFRTIDGVTWISR